MSNRLPRSRPEWVTFAVAVAILGSVLLLIAAQTLGPDRPADPVATRDGPTRRVGERYVIAVTVENRGNRTATNVQVFAELRTDKRTSVGDQTIEFLPGHSTAQLEFRFDDDPDAAASSFTVGVVSFAPG